MVNGTRTIYLQGLNKGFGSKFCVNSRVRHETLEEGRRKHRPKRSEHNNEGEDKRLNIPSDKIYQASSKKFRQINIVHYFMFHAFEQQSSDRY